MRLNAQAVTEEARRILALAWPVMLTNLNWTLLHLIDVAVVGQHGTASLGELAAGRTLTYISVVMGLAAMSGVLIFTARADGAGEPLRTGDYLRQGILLGLGIGIGCMAVLLPWAEALLRLAGVPDTLSAGGSDVVRMMALGYPAQFVQVAASYFLEGVSRPRRVMVVNLVQLPLNALLAWAWVGGHFGLPAWGAAGAAAATSTIGLLGAVAMLASVWTLPGGAGFGVRDLSAAAWRRAAAGVGATARFGLMPAAAAGLELAGFSWLIVLSTQLGAVSAAAFQSVFSLHNLAFGVGMGFGSAAGVRAGNAVGAGEPERAGERAIIAAMLTTLVMGGAGLLFLLFPTALLSAFTTDPEVIALSVGMLALLAPFMLFDGVQTVFVNVLRALGDQVVAGVNTILAFFLVMGGVGWLLVRAGGGPAALIWGTIAGMVVATLLQGARLAWISRSYRRS